MLPPAILLGGCAAVVLPDYTKRPVDEYENRVFKEDLAVAIQPLTRKEDIEKYFGTNLLADNILPVFVLLENRSSAASYVLLKDRIKLVARQLSQPGASVQEALTIDRSASAVAGAALASTAGQFGFAPLVLAMLPLLVFGDNLAAHASEARYALAVRELHSRTIPPGKSVNGFVYFRMPQREPVPDRWAIQADILRLDTNTPVTFELPFTVGSQPP